MEMEPGIIVSRASLIHWNGSLVIILSTSCNSATMVVVQSRSFLGTYHVTIWWTKWLNTYTAFVWTQHLHQPHAHQALSLKFACKTRKRPHDDGHLISTVYSKTSMTIFHRERLLFAVDTPFPRDVRYVSCIPLLQLLDWMWWPDSIRGWPARLELYK